MPSCKGIRYTIHRDHVPKEKTESTGITKSYKSLLRLSVNVVLSVAWKIVDSDNSPKVVVTQSEFVLEDKLQPYTVYTPRTQQEKYINNSRIPCQYAHYQSISENTKRLRN